MTEVRRVSAAIARVAGLQLRYPMTFRGHKALWFRRGWKSRYLQIEKSSLTGIQLDVYFIFETVCAHISS
jgi:hypothetical protein